MREETHARSPALLRAWCSRYACGHVLNFIAYRRARSHGRGAPARQRSLRIDFKYNQQLVKVWYKRSCTQRLFAKAVSK